MYLKVKKNQAELFLSLIKNLDLWDLILMCSLTFLTVLLFELLCMVVKSGVSRIWKSFKNYIYNIVGFYYV